MPLSWRSVFEETTLRAFALVAFRHSDKRQHAHGNEAHVALGLFRNVPKVDLELIMPHQQVCMPALQRSQAHAGMGPLGAFTDPLLLHQEALSVAGILTLYTLAAFAVRTAVRWRSTKQLYQQLLLSYQSANRIGSSDGALLYVTHLAEVEEQRAVLLSLRALLRRQQGAAAAAARDSGRRVDAERPRGAVNSRVLRTWSELTPLGIDAHCALPCTLGHLLRLGVVDETPPAAPPVEPTTVAEPPSPSDAAEPLITLSPIEEAIAIARRGGTSCPPRVASSTSTMI